MARPRRRRPRVGRSLSASRFAAVGGRCQRRLADLSRAWLAARYERSGGASDHVVDAGERSRLRDRAFGARDGWGDIGVHCGSHSERKAIERWNGGSPLRTLLCCARPRCSAESNCAECQCIALDRARRFATTIRHSLSMTRSTTVIWKWKSLRMSQMDQPNACFVCIRYTSTHCKLSLIAR